MFSQFAEGEKMSSAIFSSDVMHMFCLQLLVCSDTFFGPERLTRVRMAYRAWLFIFVTRGYIYSYMARRTLGRRKLSLLTQPVS